MRTVSSGAASVTSIDARTVMRRELRPPVPSRTQGPTRSLVAHRRGKSGHLRGICTQAIDDRRQVAHLSLDDAPIDASRGLQALKIVV